MLTESPAGVAGTVAGSHVYADEGAYTVTVTVTDDDGASSSDTFAVVARNVAPTIALSGAADVDEGSTYALTLGAVTDPGADTVFRYIVHWGDGKTNTYSVGGLVTHDYGDGPSG